MILEYKADFVYGDGELMGLVKFLFPVDQSYPYQKLLVESGPGQRERSWIWFSIAGVRYGIFHASGEGLALVIWGYNPWEQHIPLLVDMLKTRFGEEDTWVACDTDLVVLVWGMDDESHDGAMAAKLADQMVELW